MSIFNKIVNLFNGNYNKDINNAFSNAFDPKKNGATKFFTKTLPSKLGINNVKEQVKKSNVKKGLTLEAFKRAIELAISPTKILLKKLAKGKGAKETEEIFLILLGNASGSFGISVAGLSFDISYSGEHLVELYKKYKSNVLKVDDLIEIIPDTITIGGSFDVSVGFIVNVEAVSISGGLTLYANQSAKEIKEYLELIKNPNGN